MKPFLTLSMAALTFFTVAAHAAPTTSILPPAGSVAPFVNINSISTNKNGLLVVTGASSEPNTEVMINFPNHTTKKVLSASKINTNGLYSYQAVSNDFEPSGVLYATPLANERLGTSAQAYWEI